MMVSNLGSPFGCDSRGGVWPWLAICAPAGIHRLFYYFYLCFGDRLQHTYFFIIIYLVWLPTSFQCWIKSSLEYREYSHSLSTMTNALVRIVFRGLSACWMPRQWQCILETCPRKSLVRIPFEHTGLALLQSSGLTNSSRPCSQGFRWSNLFRNHWRRTCRLCCMRSIIHFTILEMSNGLNIQMTLESSVTRFVQRWTIRTESDSYCA